VVLARRDSGDKRPVPLAALAGLLPAVLEEIQSGMYAAALAARDARTVDVSSVDEAAEAAASGFARIPWAALADGGVERLGRDAVTVRCLQTPDGDLPTGGEDSDLVALVARAY
jgi:prolyl-tRNA synthetase